MPKKNPSMALPILPEDIQRIIVLSLPPKAFARSSVLSKSWLSFYNSTRYSFDFSLQYNPNRAPEELLEEIMNFDKSLTTNLLREKLTVDEFNINYQHSRELADLIYKWLATLFTSNNIVKVVRIKKPKSFGNLYLPPEIFSNESLQVLHLQDCILNPMHPKNLGCLRVLSLLGVSIDGKSMDRLLTACPILEQLTLCKYFGEHFITIKGLHKLTDLDIRGFADVRIQEAPALENIFLKNYDDRTIINSRVCRRIKHLKIIVDSKKTATHIQQIVSCLPALENLKLTMMGATEGIRISSPCLKNLKLFPCNHHLIMVEVNAPNLQCYEYNSKWPLFSRHLMMKTGMLEMVVIILDMPFDKGELWKVLRMIEHLKLGVDTIEYVSHIRVRVQASRLDEKLNVPARSVIEKLDAGAVKLNDDRKFLF